MAVANKDARARTGRDMQCSMPTHAADVTSTSMVTGRRGDVFAMLPLASASANAASDAKNLSMALDRLKLARVRGVMIDVWWGVVERAAPRSYAWDGYVELIGMCRARGLEAHCVLSFHACGSSVGDGGCAIPLPPWAAAANGDDYFTDARGGQSREYLSLWSDETRARCRGDRSPSECYGEFAERFAERFADDIRDGVITQVIVGLGPCGELRYPSYCARRRWGFPGAGALQCYDERARAAWAMDAASRGGVPEWGRAPPNDGARYNADPDGRALDVVVLDCGGSGGGERREASESESDDDGGEQSPERKQRRLAMSRSASSASNSLADLRVSSALSISSLLENSRRHDDNEDEDAFFREAYATARGKHFLSWYARELTAHADRVLERVCDAFHRAGVDPEIGIKCPGVHWWVKHPSRAAECAAGYYGADGESAYAEIVRTCAKFNASLTFTCVEMRDIEHDAAHMCSPETLLAQVLRDCATHGVRVHGENALFRLDDDAYSQILRAYGKINTGDDDNGANTNMGALSSFTFLRSCDALFEEENFARFTDFIRRMSA